MTADVELLPLPIIGEGFNAADIRELMTDYARTCVAHATAAQAAEVEALRAEVREAREFRDKMANAIGSDQLRRFIEKHGEPVPLTIRMQQAEARADNLRAEVEKLRALAGCAYQMAGMHDAPLVWLDRLSEAANGDVLPDADTLMDELLPYQPDAVCEAEARAERLEEALREWWSAHRPVGWTEDQHRACPYVNLPTDTDKALAEALLRDQEEGNGQ